MKKIALVLLILMSCFGLLFAKGSTEAPGAVVAQDFVYGVAAAPAGFDPPLQSAHNTILVARYLYSQLLYMDAKMELKGRLAEKWEQGANNTYTFYLRKGVKFHNGREMTADDVAYSINRVKDEAFGSFARTNFASVQKIEAVDKYTVKFILSNPDAAFLLNLTNLYASIVPKEAVEQYGNLQNNPVGTGPFMLKEVIPGNRVVMVKNPNYFEPGEPRLDTLTFVIMPDESARLNALRAGSIHFTELSPANVPLVKGNKDITVYDFLTTNLDVLGLNVVDPPFNDLRVRQAVSLLIDRQEIVNVVYDGQAQITGPVPVSQVRWAIDVRNNEFYKPDVARAKTLLAQAGFPNGLDIKITAGISPRTVDIAQLLVSQLAKGGVKAEIVMRETAQFVADWRERNLQSMSTSNGGGSDPDRAIGFFWHSTASANVWGYKNPRMDQLAEAGRIETDFAKRYAIYKEAQEIVLKDIPNIFLVTPKTFHFLRSNVQGYIAETFYNGNLTGVWLK